MSSTGEAMERTAESMLDRLEHDGAPWSARTWEDDPGISILDAQGTIIADMVGDADHPRTQQQSEYIVKCCNGYPKAIEALRNLASDYEQGAYSRDHLLAAKNLLLEFASLSKKNEALSQNGEG